MLKNGYAFEEMIKFMTPIEYYDGKETDRMLLHNYINALTDNINYPNMLVDKVSSNIEGTKKFLNDKDEPTQVINVKTTREIFRHSIPSRHYLIGSVYYFVTNGKCQLS